MMLLNRVCCRRFADTAVVVRSEDATAVVVRSDDAMAVVVRSKNDEVTRLNLGAESTVLDLKEKVHTTRTYRTSQQKLSFRGKTLENEKRLTEYVISGNSIIDLELTYEGEIGLTIFDRRERKTFNILTDYSKTIAELKRQIEEVVGYPAAEQIVRQKEYYYSRNKLHCHLYDLKDDETIASYNITGGSFLRLKLKAAEKVFVKTLTGKIFTMHMDTTHDLVDDLYDDFSCVSGIPLDQLRLIARGKQLEHGRLLSYYDFQAESTIHAVLCLRGGGPDAFITVVIVLQHGGFYYERSVELERPTIDLKEQIMRRLRIPVARQTLVYNGDVMVDNRRVCEYGVEYGSSINLIVELGEGARPYVTITVTVQGRDNGTVITDRNSSIDRLREEICDVFHIPPSYQILKIANDVVLQDGRNLTDYNITDGSTLKLQIGDGGARVA